MERKPQSRQGVELFMNIIFDDEGNATYPNENKEEEEKINITTGDICIIIGAVFLGIAILASTIAGMAS
jgi:hypothetical protein